MTRRAHFEKIALPKKAEVYKSPNLRRFFCFLNMQELETKEKVTIVKGRLEGEAMFGPYRSVLQGEPVDPEDVMHIVQNGDLTPYVPIRIYGVSGKGKT